MKSSNLPGRAARALLGAALIAALGACGGDGAPAPAPDPLQKYREQTVAWTECDPTILGSSSPATEALWEQTGERLRCALVRAPLDWANADRGDVVIGVMRLAAGAPQRRRGALLLNPGGPGGDGLSLTFSLLQAFAGSNPDDPQGARQLQLLDEYDMVGFSPRGVGASTRLNCGTNELERFVNTSADKWDTPGNIDNAYYNGAKTAEACLKNPLTPHINTDATARDMDLLRGLLGDEKLNYLGYSYGTWLGAWYASLFPEKTGRMVLDSSTDFTATLEQTIMLGQPPTRQRLLDEVLIPYAARHHDYFQLGATEAEVRAILPGLSPEVQQVTAEPLMDFGYGRKNADPYLGTIAAARGLDAVLKAAPDLSDTNALAAALARYPFTPANPALDANIRSLALGLLQRYINAWIKPQPSSIALNSSMATLFAVHCNDTPAVTDLAAWTGQMRDMARRAPMFFGNMLEFRVCAFWGGPSVAKPDLAPMKPLNVLFVQSQYDAATYTEGANAFFAQLPGAHRVYVPGDFQHGVYPYQDACVDPLVTGYLLGDSPAEREAVCTGKPLAQDAPPASAKAARATSAYKDPDRAAELIEQFKRGLIPPSIRH